MSQQVRLPASVLVALVLVGAVAVNVAHLVNHVTAKNRLFDAGLENNIPTWLSSAAFLLAALGALQAAVGRRGAARIAWCITVAFCAAASVDEVASLHEEAGERLGAEPTLTLTQPLAALMVAAVLLLLARVELDGVRALVVAAAGALLLSQTMASVAGLHTSGNLEFLLEAGEELTETLTAVALLAAALTACGLRVDVRPTALRRELSAWWSDSSGPTTVRHLG